MVALGRPSREHLSRGEVEHAFSEAKEKPPSYFTKAFSSIFTLKDKFQSTAPVLVRICSLLHAKVRIERSIYLTKSLGREQSMVHLETWSQNQDYNCGVGKALEALSWISRANSHTAKP